MGRYVRTVADGLLDLRMGERMSGGGRAALPIYFECLSGIQLMDVARSPQHRFLVLRESS